MARHTITIREDHLRTLVRAAALHYRDEKRKHGKRKTLRKDAACWAMEMSDIGIAVEQCARQLKEQADAATT